MMLRQGNSVLLHEARHLDYTRRSQIIAVGNVCTTYLGNSRLGKAEQAGVYRSLKFGNDFPCSKIAVICYFYLRQQSLCPYCEYWRRGPSPGILDHITSVNLEGNNDNVRHTRGCRPSPAIQYSPANLHHRRDYEVNRVRSNVRHTRRYILGACYLLLVPLRPYTTSSPQWWR